MRCSGQLLRLILALRKWTNDKLRVLDHAEDNLVNLMKVLPDDDGDYARFRQLLDATKLPIANGGAKPEVLAAQAEEVYGKTNAALTLVSLRAEDVREKEERRLALVTYGAYALVILGILVAAVGQAYER